MIDEDQNLNEENVTVQVPGRYIRLVKSIKAKADAKRSLIQKAADFTTAQSGSVWFLLVNTIFFAVWIIINLGLTSIRAFDPFPFGLLTMIVSLEAIILAIFVLISQNREEKINNLRDEIALQVEIITEKKIVKILEKLDALLKKQGLIIKHDGEEKEMLQPTNVGKIEKVMEKQIGK